MGIWHLLEADACKHKETGKSAPLSRLIIACLEGDKIVRAMSKVLHDDDEQGPAVRDLQRGGRAVLAAGRVTGSRTAPGPNGNLARSFGPSIASLRGRGPPPRIHR